MKPLRRWLDRISFVGVSSGVFLFGYLQGTYPIRLEIAFIALAVVFLQAKLSSVMFTGFISVSSLAYLWSLDRKSHPDPETSGDSVTAIVPVYRDAGVLHRSVESLRQADYEDLEICIVCEPDDVASIDRASELAGYDDVEYLLNTRYTGSKAGAINYAVEETDSDHVAVFDADEEVDPAFVGRAIAQLDDYDIVQGRTVPQPDGFVEELAYYESVLLNYVGRRLLYLFTGFTMAASRSVVMRRSAFERVGGYDTGMLTEDFDFAYACYKKRLAVQEMLVHPSKIEAAHSITDWWGQRKRWMTGYAQVLHKMLATIRPMRGYRDLTSVAICASTVGGSLLLLSILSKFLVLALVGARGLFALPIATVICATAMLRIYDNRLGNVDDVGLAFVLVPLLLPLYSLTAIKAFVEYLFSWDGGWYSVDKGV
jgi:cellulose synthase/poly-beta-1,6-N-acetylglucosamine synthase-like glycosyltransferase